MSCSQARTQGPLGEAPTAVLFFLTCIYFYVHLEALNLYGFLGVFQFFFVLLLLLTTVFEWIASQN